MPERLATGQPRTPGDDVVVQVRVRSANLPALEDGVELGVDSLTGSAIELRLVPRADGVHDLEVVTNPLSMLATPDPVDAHVVPPSPADVPPPGETWPIVEREPEHEPMVPPDLAIARTVDEIERMADAWLAGDSSICPWTEGTARLFGSECAWPLMTYVAKFVKAGCDPDPLDRDEAITRYRERLEFMVEKAEGERGISTPKAREQVNAYLWLFGRDDFVRSAGFAPTAARGRELLAELDRKGSPASGGDR